MGKKAALYSEITALVGNPTRKLGFVLENGQGKSMDRITVSREGDKVIIEQRSLAHIIFESQRQPELQSRPPPMTDKRVIPG